jgi:crossover junction endodeoxyribonuclease RuvC
MILLGIDPGFRFAGFGVAKKEGTRVSILDYGFLRLQPTKPLVERTGLFHSFFDEKIKTHGVTHLALETPFLGKNAQNFMKLGYLRGILYLLTHTYKLELHEFAPRQVKSAITGSGAASKEQVARVIYQLLPRLKAPQRDDVTDALAITLCGLWQQKNPYHMLK